MSNVHVDCSCAFCSALRRGHISPAMGVPVVDDGELVRLREEVARLQEYGRQLHAAALRNAAALVRLGDDKCRCHDEHVRRESVVELAMQLKTSVDAYRAALGDGKERP